MTAPELDNLVRIGMFARRLVVIGNAPRGATRHVFSMSKANDRETSRLKMVIWQLSGPQAPSTHRYQYRLYYGSGGTSRVRYDNERGKGDHRHIGAREEEYVFGTLEQLLEDFRRDVENWR
jgi:hypothetical protein